MRWLAIFQGRVRVSAVTVSDGTTKPVTAGSHHTPIASCLELVHDRGRFRQQLAHPLRECPRLPTTRSENGTSMSRKAMSMIGRPAASAASRATLPALWPRRKTQRADGQSCFMTLLFLLLFALETKHFHGRRKTRSAIRIVCPRCVALGQPAVDG